MRLSWIARHLATVVDGAPRPRMSPRLPRLRCERSAPVPTQDRTKERPPERGLSPPKSPLGLSESGCRTSREAREAKASKADQHHRPCRGFGDAGGERNIRHAGTDHQTELIRLRGVNPNVGIDLSIADRLTALAAKSSMGCRQKIDEVAFTRYGVERHDVVRQRVRRRTGWRRVGQPRRCRAAAAKNTSAKYAGMAVYRPLGARVSSGASGVVDQHRFDLRIATKFDMHQHMRAGSSQHSENISRLRRNRVGGDRAGAGRNESGARCSRASYRERPIRRSIEVDGCWAVGPLPPNAPA